MGKPDTHSGRAAPPAPLKSFTALGVQVPAPPLAPGLHIIATPIGNLADISLRALRVLAGADAILAEDTRVSSHLLNHYGIGAKLIAYHEHNAAQMRPRVLARLAAGEALALISDAGTPLISDPGYRLVAQALEAGATVSTAPGACAVIAALSISGLPTDRFFFEGFLPPRSAARRARLRALAAIPGTLAFYESPRRVAAALADMASDLGPRPAAVLRELTKLYEEVKRGPLDALAAHYRDAPEPRGEFVVLVAPPAAPPAPAAEAIDAALEAALRTLSVKDAAAQVAHNTKSPKRDIYARALALSAAKRR